MENEKAAERITYLDPEGWEWKALHDICTRSYLAPNCYEFAIACHEGLGWPIVGFMQGEEIWHVGTRAPDGRLFDARGFVSEESFGLPFGHEHPDMLCFNKEALERGGVKATENRRVIEGATRLAHTLWPTLPWTETGAQRLDAFLPELEAICKKYGILIWSSTKASRTMISVNASPEDIGTYIAEQAESTELFMLHNKRR